MPKRKRGLKKHPIPRIMKGNVIVPILFIVVAFGVLLTSGTLYNKSATNSSEEYGEAQTEAGDGKQNLQLKNVSFRAKPTPVPSSDCNHDNGNTTTKDCACQEFLIECKNHQCVRVYKSGMNPSAPTPDGEDCATHPMKSIYDLWCNSGGLTNGDGIYCLGKPVIYLYPEKPTYVDVEVITEGEIVVSDPLYPAGGWKNVLAHPDGTLTYNNKQYRELFYETQSRALRRPEAGIIVSKKNLEPDLRAFITRLGLSRPDEQQEFLDWWIPKLQAIKTDRLFVSILEHNEKERVDKVTISPKPDTMIEFIVYFAPLSDGETVASLVLPGTPKRTGFTAVEWGGVIGH